MDYVDRIRELREDKHLSQTKIASLLPVGQKTYSDYETRKIRLPVESLIKLARFYDVDMNYICGLSQKKNKFPG